MPAAAYRKGILRGIEKSELRPLAPAVLMRSLMGVTRSIGLKWIIWKADPQADLPDRLIHGTIEFIFFGLCPRPYADQQGPDLGGEKSR